MARFLVNILNRLELILPHIFRQGGPPPSAFAVAGHYESNTPWNTNTHSTGDEKFSLRQLLGDGILWAVPKHRRSVEKRLNRKFGYPEFNWKPLRIKTNLRSCNQCGHDYEAGVLCPHCYSKVREETKLMQDQIQSELGLEPVDKEVIVLYDGERSKMNNNEEWQGKRIVEMKKPRPMWFSKNLLQKSTQTPPSETTEVKPSDLG